jgi:hypothetical protein
MTPKETAKDLFDKYLHTTAPTREEYCKQCALIAVDELIYETQFEVPNIRQRYWIDVKQEIKNI